MVELFKFLVISGFVYIFFLILRDKYFRHMVAMTVAIVIFGSGYLWCVNFSNKVEKKVESVNKTVYGVQKSMDKLSGSLDKIGGVKNKADGTVKKLNDYDKKIVDTVNRWLGRDKK